MIWNHERNCHVIFHSRIAPIVIVLQVKENCRKIICFTPTSSNFTLGPFPFFNSSCRFRVIIANKTSLWVPTKPIRSWSLVRWSCNPGRNPKIQPDLAKIFVAVNFAIWILSCCLPQVDHKDWHSKTLRHFSQLMIPVYKEIPKNTCTNSIRGGDHHGIKRWLRRVASAGSP